MFEDNPSGVTKKLLFKEAFFVFIFHPLNCS